MPDKKATKKKKPEINISIGGNVTGNILLGDKNTVDQPPNKTVSLRYWMMAGAAGFIVLVIALSATWKALNSLVKFDYPLPNVAVPTSTPVPLGVWQVEVFDNVNLNGSPISTFTESAEANSEGGYQISIEPQSLRQQVSATPAINYSVRLVGTFEFEQGYFEFHCEHHDGCRVYVDGRNWIDAWWDGGGGNDLARDLSAGNHVVVIEFYDKSGYGLLEVRWRIKP